MVSFSLGGPLTFCFHQIPGKIGHGRYLVRLYMVSPLFKHWLIFGATIFLPHHPGLGGYLISKAGGSGWMAFFNCLMCPHFDGVAPLLGSFTFLWRSGFQFCVPFHQFLAFRIEYCRHCFSKCLRLEINLEFQHWKYSYYPLIHYLKRFYCRLATQRFLCLGPYTWIHAML